MSQNSDVVVYHNDLNKLNLGNFSELEQNLLMIVLVACKKSKNVEIKMTAIDLLKFMNKNLTNHELFEISANLKDNFFKLDFTIVKKIEESGSINRFLKSTYNLFSKFDIYYVGNDLLAEKDPNSKLEYIELKVNPEFAYLINEITAHFTEFELEEFICIRSKYAKTLYRLLKQWRNAGERTFKYDDFKEKMGIPESYQQCNIKKQILDPSIKILKSEIKTNLFDARVPFKNLKYEFLKAAPNGKRGGRAIEKIKFTFDIDSKKIESSESSNNIESSKTNLSDSDKFELSETAKEFKENFLNKYVPKHTLNSEIKTINDIEFYYKNRKFKQKNERNEIEQIEMISIFSPQKVWFRNVDTKKEFLKSFNDFNHLKNWCAECLI